MHSWRMGAAIILNNACLSRGQAVPAAQAERPSWLPKERQSLCQRVKGPSGLEAWTVCENLKDVYDSPLPTHLLIARHGHILRRITGGPFFWDLYFPPNGKQFAYTAGPLYFDMTCVLIDIKTAKQIATADCYHEEDEQEPDWVRYLRHAQDQ